MRPWISQALCSVLQYRYFSCVLARLIEPRVRAAGAEFRSSLGSLRAKALQPTAR